jgi:hypothetical protein
MSLIPPVTGKSGIVAIAIAISAQETFAIVFAHLLVLLVDSQTGQVQSHTIQWMQNP